MSAPYFAKMIEAAIWADEQLFACAEGLTEAQLNQDFGYSFKTVLRQLFHLVEVQYWWFTFLDSGEYDFMYPEDYTTLAEVRAKATETQALLRRYAAKLTDAELARMVKPKFWTPETAPWSVWEAVHQVVNHSTDHRAQTLMFIHRLGGKTFQQDYLFYERPELIED
jgi:uncharacterized damage-inducible protein DinB